MKDFRLLFEEKDIQDVAARFLEITKYNRHIAFYGDMGSGKTTFITALCNYLETPDLVSSPTFAIINEYATKEGDPIFHFDFYRIENPNELLDIGFYEYLSDDAFCFIEWPQKAEEIIPDDFLKVLIEVEDSGRRVLKFSI